MKYIHNNNKSTLEFGFGVSNGWKAEDRRRGNDLTTALHNDCPTHNDCICVGQSLWRDIVRSFPLRLSSAFQPLETLHNFAHIHMYF